ncbi:hypothetical protein [Streptomyces yangpuensis]
MEIDYKHHGGVTTVPLYSAEDFAPLPVVRPSVDVGQCHWSGRHSLYS